MSVEGFTVDTTDFRGGLRRLSEINGKTQADNLLSFAKTTLTNRSGSGLIDQAPPGSPGVTGIAAKQRGEATIERDLSAIFAAVRLKHKRIEQHPDPEAIHSRLFAGKRPGAPLRSDRGKYAKYYVDKQKLAALTKKLKSRVGRLASGWLVAAHRLGVRAPAWIERHGAGAGDVRVQLRPPSYEIEMAIVAPDNSPVAELERRVEYALKDTQWRIDAAIEGASAAAARKAGFKVSA